MKNTEEKINCLKCRHFYITWDKNFPNGCKAMRFKSRQMPSVDTEQSSGVPCLRFAPKEPNRA